MFNQFLQVQARLPSLDKQRLTSRLLRLILQQLRALLDFIGRLTKSSTRIQINILQTHISLELVLILNLVDIQLLTTSQILRKCHLRFVPFKLLPSDSVLETSVNFIH